MRIVFSDCKAALAWCSVLLLFCAAGVARADGGRDATEDDSSATEAAIESYREEQLIDHETAELIISDQEALPGVLEEAGVDMGVNADVWIEPSEGGQTVTVRTTDEEMITELVHSANTLEATEILIEESEPMDSTVLKDPDFEETVTDLVPDAQGMYVRLSDGALVIDSSTDVADSTIDELLEASGLESVVVDVHEEVADDSLTIRGGAALTSCTSGFAAKRGSQIGFYTAAHCTSTQRIYSSPSSTSGSSTVGTRRVQTYNSNADIAFYSVGSSNVLASRFYGANGALSRVGAPVNVGEGTMACHRGKVTKWQCGRVTSIAYKPVYKGACPSGSCKSTFVRVSAKQAKGDSGGPWLLGTSPLGIHKGGASTWSIYSQIHYKPSGTTIF